MLLNIRANCTFLPLCIGEFQSPPLSIERSNVFLYLLKLCNLTRTSIFLLNTNRIYAKCLKYPILTHLTQPIQSLNLEKKKKKHEITRIKSLILIQKISRSLSSLTSLSRQLLPPLLTSRTSHGLTRLTSSLLTASC